MLEDGQLRDSEEAPASDGIEPAIKPSILKAIQIPKTWERKRD